MKEVWSGDGDSKVLAGLYNRTKWYQYALVSTNLKM